MCTVIYISWLLKIISYLSSAPTADTLSSAHLHQWRKNVRAHAMLSFFFFFLGTAHKVVDYFVSRRYLNVCRKTIEWYWNSSLKILKSFFVLFFYHFWQNIQSATFFIIVQPSQASRILTYGPLVAGFTQTSQTSQIHCDEITKFERGLEENEKIKHALQTTLRPL